jgi:hypothetical protein
MAVGSLLDDAPRRERYGHAALERVAAEHDLTAAARRLDGILRGLLPAVQ